MDKGKGKSSKSSSSKRDRKTMEKDRRNHMKNLYSELNSLIPNQDPSFQRAIPDQIEDATNYIRQLQENVDNLKQTRDDMQQGSSSSSSPSSRHGHGGRGSRYYSMNSPVQIEVKENGNTLEVTLITGLECQFVFTEAVRIIHEENAEVVNASYSVAENIVFHTIHVQINEVATTDAAARITARLKNFEL